MVQNKVSRNFSLSQSPVTPAGYQEILFDWLLIESEPKRTMQLMSNASHPLLINIAFSITSAAATVVVVVVVRDDNI
jgi:hypothetical protein